MTALFALAVVTLVAILARKPAATATPSPIPATNDAGTSSAGRLAGILPGRTATPMATSYHEAHRPGNPLPPPDTPWKELYAELAGPADAGDARAAERLYADTMHCKGHLSARITAEAQLASNTPVSGMSGNDIAIDGKRLGRAEDILDRYGKLCAGVTEDELDEHVYSILKYAAIAGNELAAGCYVIAPYPVRDELRHDPAALEEYRSNALGFVGNGIRQGDWAMLDAIAAAYGGGIEPPTWQNELVQPDPLAFYACVKVELLGADIEAVDAIGHRLQAIREENRLTAEQIETADSWANAVYTKYFAGKPPFSGHSSYCGAERASGG